MPVEEELYLTGTGRAQSVYQQPSTGEKHVLFYPTSPAPSANSEERRSWSQASSSAANTHATSNHKISNNNQETPRMKRNDGAASNPPDSGGTHEIQTTPSHSEPRYHFKIGIYGWRKRCLYILILGLLVMVIINLALTLWVLKVMEFSSQGMGQLRIVAGGLRLEGRAFVLDALIASTIRSRAGQPIVIESSKNFTVTTRDAAGVLDNRIFLGNDRFECLTDNFKVINTKGTVLFSADHKEVVLGVDVLRITGEGGTIFGGSVQTPLVRAESGHDLRLESPTRTLEMRAPMGINVESRAGDIKLMSLNDIKLKSVAGSIRLESGSVYMPSLPTAINPSERPAHIRPHEIFQVCVCENGKLFLAPSQGVCATADEHFCR